MRRGCRLATVVLAAAAATLALGASARAVSVPWCGTGEPTTDLPDAVSAFEWHVVYAVPAGGVDNFASFAPRFAGDVAAMSTWWQGQDPTRRPRFDLIEAPSCPTESGRIDISLVRVPAAVSDYKGVTDAVRAAGLESPDKGYLVYFEGSEPGVCGRGGRDNVALAYSVVYLQACGLWINDEQRTIVAMHEMTHGMGAVSDSAPHSCSSHHVCDNPNDLMKPGLSWGDTLANSILDAGRDDYYAHAGGWWDVRNSVLLYDLDQSLAPAPDIAGLTATSTDTLVRVDWAPSGMYYRLYDENGKLTNGILEATHFILNGSLGQTLTWTIRSVAAGGFLSRPATLHFKVGFGIVDGSGALLKDTVRPAETTHLRVIVAGLKVVLRWQAVADPIGLRGYRVTIPGLKPMVVAGTAASFPTGRVRGKMVSVAAVDRSGNVGAAATARIR